MDNYNYPMGADTQDAPWNEIDVPEIEITATASVLLTKKKIKIATDYYALTGDGCELLCDHNDVKEMFEEQCNSIPFLLEQLSKYINSELKLSTISIARKIQLKSMLEDCTGWTQESIEIDDYEI